LAKDEVGLQPEMRALGTAILLVSGAFGIGGLALVAWPDDEGVQIYFGTIGLVVAMVAAATGGLLVWASHHRP
jgi:hypothetical protein